MQRTTTAIGLVTGLLTAMLCTIQLSLAQEEGPASAAQASENAAFTAGPDEPVDPLAGFDPGAQALQIALPNSSATALLREARGGQAQGTVLLLPGNRRPYPGSATEQLYRLLPEYQWQVVVLALAPLPASRHGQLFSANPTPETGAAQAPDSEAGETADKADPADTAEAPAPKGAGEMTATPRTYAEWELDSTRRVAGAIAALQARGVAQLWLVGEGYGAQVAARFLATDTPGPVLGVSYINARVPPELDASWPGDPALPALDILDPRLGVNLARQRRQMAVTAMAENYSQLRVSQSSVPRLRNETLVSRRLRGWLSRQVKSLQAS